MRTQMSNKLIAFVDYVRRATREEELSEGIECSFSPEDQQNIAAMAHALHNELYKKGKKHDH